MPAIIQRNQSAFAPSYAITSLPQGAEGSTSPSDYFQISQNTVTLSGSYNNYQITDTSLTGDATTPVNLTPGVCSIANWPIVEKITAGTGVVKLSNSRASVTIPLTFSAGVGSSYKAVTGFVAGTYAQFSEDTLTPLLSGELNLFTSSAFTSYNLECWAAGFDFSGVSYYNSVNGLGKNPVTMVAPRFGVMARHFSPSVAVGTEVRFRLENGTESSHTVVATSASAPFYNDCLMVQFDSNVPSGVAKYPVAGDWIAPATGDPYHGEVWGYVGIKLNQYREALLTIQAAPYPSQSPLQSGLFGSFDLSALKRSHVEYGGVPAAFSSMSAFWKTAVGGDSGSPCFAPLSSSTMALVTCFETTLYGPFPTEGYLNALIAFCENLAGTSTGQTVTVATDPA